MIEDHLIQYYDLIFENNNFVYNTLSKQMYKIDKKNTYKRYKYLYDDEIEIHKFTVNSVLHEINSNTILTLRIIGSYRCNACCKYCYQNNLKINDYSVTLDFSLLQNFIFDYILYNNITGIQFFWYGGEPLCYFDEIVDFIIELKKHIPKHILIFNDISTNGYFLNSSLIHKCNELPNLSLSICMEPSKFLQKEYRSPKTKKTGVSYHKFMENVSLFSSLYKTTFIFVLAKYNVDALFEFPKLLKKYNITKKDVFIGKLTNTTNCLPSELKNQLIRIDHFIKLRNELYLNFINCGFDVPIQRFNPFNSGCNYFVKNSFVVLPSGKISKCHVYTDDKLHIKGNTSTLKKDIDFFDSFNECFKCKLLPICKGGCVNRYIKKSKRACLMKTTDGQNFNSFPVSIIEQALKMMYVLKNNKQSGAFF